MFAFDTGHKDYPRSAEIADFLLDESRLRGELLTPLKLQKLIYYADAWFMALYDDELTDERFQAWVHGPVALSQYHRFKDFKWKPISDDIVRPEVSDRVSKHLMEIVDVFGVETATALERMTHQERPWLEARAGIPDDEPCNLYISKDTTREYYRSIAEED